MTICKICLMNDDDPLITYDSEGVCSHCRDWERAWAEKLKLEAGRGRVFEQIKRRGKDAPYDAVIGLSGGADSSYVYHLAKSNGLRVLPMHFDNGYDLPVSTHNVKCLVDKWGDKLETIRVDGPEFRGLQLAFLKSGTTGLEIPTDHAIQAVTYQTARKWGIPTLLDGRNLATESHGTRAWTAGHSDWKYIRSVGEAFGVHLRRFPHYTWTDKRTWVKRFTGVSLLNYTRYFRDEAIALLGDEYGYQPYGFKHMESRITRFLHGYIIPRRFGWDTRRSRVSAMIASGQMTREEGLTLLASPPYSADEMELDRLHLCKSLGITTIDFEDLMRLPLKHFSDYPSYQRDMASPLYRAARLIYRVLR